MIRKHWKSSLGIDRLDFPDLGLKSSMLLGVLTKNLALIGVVIVLIHNRAERLVQKALRKQYLGTLWLATVVLLVPSYRSVAGLLSLNLECSRKILVEVQGWNAALRDVFVTIVCRVVETALRRKHAHLRSDSWVSAPVGLDLVFFFGS